MKLYGKTIQITHPGSHFVGGAWVSPISPSPAEVIDPSTEERYEGFLLGGPADADRAISAARQAFDDGPWPTMDPAARAAVLTAFVDHLTKRRGELEEAWTRQVGALEMMRGRAVDNALGHFRRAADQAAFLQVEREVASSVGDARLRQEPIGVVSAIAAWNGSLLQMASKLGPALAAGCTVIAKPAPTTPMEAIIIAECAEAAGLPLGVLNMVLLSNEGADLLVSDPRVDKVSFTGSTGIGKHIAQTCAGRIARYSLELGGKSAAIVLDDADIGAVGKQMARTITALSGQLCSMLSRVIVLNQHHDALSEAIVAEMANVRIGSAHEAATEMGPMAMQRQLFSVERHVERAKADGTRLAFGGRRPSHLDRGFFYEPTLFIDAAPGSIIAQEEVFGPVLTLIRASDEDEAVAIANRSEFGLHGAVFTPDKDRALLIARRIRTGTFAQNGMKLDFSLPFGGYKQSGVGREGGDRAIEAYLEAKTVILDL